MTMEHSTGRLTVLTLLAAVLGLAGGGASWVLLHLIAFLTNLALLHRYGWTLPSLAHFHPGPEIIVVAAGGALFVSLLALWSPVIRGHGIPEAMEAVLTGQSRISPRAAIAKPLSAAVAIGTGGPFGAEGPIIVTGGALGSLIGQVLRVSPAERKILLASGAAAGMAATFGAPLAAVVLAIELLLFEFSARALVPLAVASSVAAGVHAAYAGPGPLFDVPAHAYAGLGSLPVFAVLGLGCGLLAVVVCRGLFGVEHLFRASKLPGFWHPVAGAVVFATIGLSTPRAFGVGYDVINDVLASRLALGTLVALLLAKLAMWWVALGSGTSGGTLAPVLMVGAAFGGLFSHAVANLFPHLGLAPAAIILAAMAATFGASTRATFTAIVFAFELTRDYDAILPLIVAVVIADLVSAALLDHSLMTEKLARRGLDVPRAYTPDLLATARVRDAMTVEVESLDDTATVADARALFLASLHSAFPIVTHDGTCAGIVTRGDVLTKDVADHACVKDLASTDVVTVRPSDSLLTALTRIIDEGVEHLPVVDDGRVVGILTRTDLLRARGRSLVEEQLQRGWRPARWRQRSDGNGRAGPAHAAGLTPPGS